MCQGTARARRVSGAIRDGRWSKSLNCCLWRGKSVPLSLTEAPTAPQYQGDKTELQVALGDALQGARFPFLTPGALTSSPNLSSKPSSPFPSPKPCRPGWMGLGDLCWLRGTGWDRQLAQPLSAALSHPCSTTTTSNHPTALIPQVPLKAHQSLGCTQHG